MGRTDRALRRLDSAIVRWSAGNLGPVPYLLILRVLIALGIWVRFALYGAPDLPRWLLEVARGLLIVSLLLAARLHGQQKSERTASLFEALIAIDVFTISVFYWATGNTESDFFLFYYLPIFTAAEYRGGRCVIRAAALSSIALFAVVFTTSGDQLQNASSVDRFVRVFLPREVFFIAVGFIYALRLRRERDARDRAAVRRAQMQSLLAMKRHLAQVFNVDDILRLALDHASADLAAARIAGVITGNTFGGRRMLALAGPPSAAVPDDTIVNACDRYLSGTSTPGVFPIVAAGRTIGAIGVTAAVIDETESSSDYLQAVAEQIGSACEQVGLFSALRRLGAASVTVVQLNEHLESMLDHLVGRLGFEFATISLVDEYMGIIRAVRGRNVPPSWIARAVHKLEDKDIQCDIVRSGRTEVLWRYDSRFDYELWDRFNHEHLARIFAPIIDRGRVIGTIEAGCALSRRESVLTPQAIDAVTQLGLDRGTIVAATLPRVLLELVARTAIELTGADSASIHVYQKDAQFLVAGAGRVTREFVHAYPPSPGGIGRQAMRTREPQVLNALPPEKRALYELGIRAMAAFPLYLGSDIRGVLYVHYWRDHAFSKAELELIGTLVPQIEVAIQNYLLLQELAEADEAAAKVTGLQNVIRALASNLDLARLLEELALNALYMLDAKSVTLYEYFQEDRSFPNRAVTKGRFERPALMRMQVNPDDIVHRIVAKGESRFISDVDREPFLRQPRADQIERVRFVEREGIKSCAILILKSPYDAEIVGCLFANYDEPQEFEHPSKEPFKSLAASLASSAAIAIKVARLHVEDMGRKERDITRAETEIDALRAIDRAIVASADCPDLQQLCQVVLNEACDVLHAPVGDITIWNPFRDRLEILAHRGYPAGQPELAVSLNAGIVGTVAATRKGERIDDVRTDARYKRVSTETLSELAVPMLDGETLLGVINVEQPVSNGFTDKDKSFLETLATQAVLAIHSVDQYRRLERQVQQALALSTIAGKIQRAQGGMPVVMRLLLTGVTAKQGVAFSRAMLFMVDDRRGLLVGSDAVGAMTQEEAEGTWSTLSETERGVLRSEERVNFLDWLLDQAEVDAALLSRGEICPTSLNRAVRLTELPVAHLRGILGEALAASAPRLFTTPAHSTDPARQYLAFAYDGGAACAIGCVPIKVGDRTIALLVVDNRFRFEEGTIDPACQPVLAAFGELAAMSIEAGRLKVRLADERQLADWRTATGRIAHRFKTRFRPVQAKAGEIATALRLRDHAAARVGIEQMDDLIAQTADLLRDFQRFSYREPVVFADVDLVDVVTRLVRDHGSTFGCRIDVEAPREPIIISADHKRLPDVFIDLLVNADSVMKACRVEDPILTIRIRPNGSTVAIDVMDNGPGVPENLHDQLFLPFVTTRVDGSGLGLAIIRDLVEQHRGSIVYRPEAATGACFTIHLPLSVRPEVV
jgi:GAF domain-containing protein/signal transduction histidine kinase